MFKIIEIAAHTTRCKHNRNKSRIVTLVMPLHDCSKPQQSPSIPTGRGELI